MLFVRLQVKYMFKQETVVTKGVFLLTVRTYCDHVAKSAGLNSPVKIVPFKGEYYELKPGQVPIKASYLSLPNPEFPFLGVHFTRMALGGMDAVPMLSLYLNARAMKSSLLALESMESLTFRF